ncbi:MAG: cytochrome c3 family protein, partial [Marinobacter sp.]|nr:cytochrome c3 family protein [Marinobacter sp.]
MNRILGISLAQLLVFLALILPAAGPAANTPALAEERGAYVNAGTCEQCHQKEDDAWSHSDHAWAMRPAEAEWVLGNFDNSAFDDGAVTARFFRRDNGFWVSIEGETGEDEDFPIAYTFGYYPLQQYLVKLPRGRLQALTIAWDNRPKNEGGQRWFSLYPGQAFTPDDPLHWTGRYQNWNAMCADCHSTFLTMDYDAETDSFATTWQEQNVGCQGCHGPGREHVEWAQSYEAGADKAPETGALGLTVDFGTMDSEKIVETCAYCHSRRQALKDGQHAHEAYLDKALPATLRPDLYHADGQIQGEVYVYGSFIQSAMYKAGVTCLDCHDPHTTEVIAEGNALCTQCHNEAPPPRFAGIQPLNYDSPEHHHHPAGSEGAQCVNCHMTDETYMVVDPRRDHSFRVPRPDLTLQTGSPNACNDCHDDRSAEWAQQTLAQWYPSSDNKPAHFAVALDAFRNAENDAFIRLASLVRDRTQPSIARATAAEHLSSFGQTGVSALRSGLLSKQPLVQAYSAAAFSGIPLDDSLGLLSSLTSDEQPRAVRDQAIRSTASVPLDRFTAGDRERINELRKDYEDRLEALSALPGSRFGLATYLHRMGRYSEA